MIATRIRGTAFKPVFESAKLGTPVHVGGPSGTMVLHGDALRPAVLLASGIGVTPFLAMARQLAKEHHPHRITLFYSNRRPEDSAFPDEIRALAQRNQNFRLIATMTDAGTSAQPWQGETGFIRPDMLQGHLTDLKSPRYCFAGPPGMTTAMRSMLVGIGVAEKNMLSEEFFVY